MRPASVYPSGPIRGHVRPAGRCPAAVVGACAGLTHADRAAGGRIRDVPSTTPACPGYPRIRAVVDQIFDFLVRDFADFALQLYSKAASTPEQMQHCLRMIAKPVADERRYDTVWNDHVLALDGAYAMNP